MSALLELQERIEKTNALIAQCESVIATSGVAIAPPPSVLATIRSLGKLKQRLEAEFYEIAESEELEVYRYRLLTGEVRPTLAGVAEAWSSFQAFFGSVYALTKDPKRKKKGPEPQRLELGYGYSFASSVGVVVTVPRDVGIYAASPIEDASATVFNLIEAKDVRRDAEDLGPEPIKAPP